MTFFGNKKSGRHLLRNKGKRISAEEKKSKWSLKKKLLVIPGIVAASIAVLAVSAYAYLKWASGHQPIVEQNPAYVAATYVPYDPNNPSQTGRPPPSINSSEGAAGEQLVRAPDKYTFLLLATDDGYNTDTIMVATFDATEMTFDVVNIPRDTMVNVSWNLKKANSIYANMRVRHRGESDDIQKAMDDTAAEFARILGFNVDYWALVNLHAFVTLVNAVDGVDFYIPVNMDYDDPFQNLHIHYSRGMKHLNGQQALEVVRFRNTYAGADITRIGVQQDFLMAAVQQILAKRDTINVVDFVFRLATVFIRDVKTNIPFDNLIWFGNNMMKMESDNITFETAPGFYEDMIGPESYVTLYVDEWLDLVNLKLSPFDEDIKDTDVSILTRGADKRLFVTDGYRVGDPSWGANSRGPGTSGTSGSGSANSGTGGGASSTPAPGSSGNTSDDPADGGDGPHGDDYDPTDSNPEDFDPGDNTGEQNESDLGELADPGAPQNTSDPAPEDSESSGHTEQRIDLPPETIEPLDSDPYEDTNL